MGLPHFSVTFSTITNIFPALPTFPSPLLRRRRDKNVGIPHIKQWIVLDVRKPLPSAHLFINTSLPQGGGGLETFRILAILIIFQIGTH